MTIKERAKEWIIAAPNSEIYGSQYNAREIITDLLAEVEKLEEKIKELTNGT